MTKGTPRPRIGSDFEDFLRDEGRLVQTTAVAVKRVLPWKLKLAMGAEGFLRRKWPAG